SRWWTIASTRTGAFSHLRSPPGLRLRPAGGRGFRHGGRSRGGSGASSVSRCETLARWRFTYTAARSELAESRTARRPGAGNPRGTRRVPGANRTPVRSAALSARARQLTPQAREREGSVAPQGPVVPAHAPLAPARPGLGRLLRRHRNPGGRRPG